MTRSLSRKLIGAGLFASLLAAPGLASGAGTTLRQTVMTELRYDTNTGIVPVSEQSEGGFVFFVLPSFEAVNSRSKLVLNGTYRPSGYFYFNNPDLNSIAHSGTVSADYNVSSQTSLRAEERITVSSESLETTLIGLQNQRGQIFTNTVNLSMNSRLTQRTGITLSASDFVLNFDDPVSIDSRNDSASAALNFQATPETQLNVSYNFSHASFFPPDGSSSSQDTHSLNTGFTSRFRDSLILYMNAGAVYADIVGPGSGVFDWVAMAEIRKSFHRNEANFSYTRRTTTSSGITDQLTLSETYSAGYRHSLSSTVSLNLSGAYAHNHSKPDNRLDTKSFSAGVSSTWRAYDWLSFGAGYSHFKQEADGPLGFDTERDHFFVHLNVTTYEGRL